MRLWRRKTDGFDWHAYVRTTLLVRRRQRRENLEAIGRKAADGAVAAGAVVAQGVAKSAEGVAKGVAIGAKGVAKGAGSGWRGTAAAWRATIARPEVAFPVALVGTISAVSGIQSWLDGGRGSNTIAPLLLGTVLLGLAAPLAVSRLRLRLPTDRFSVPVAWMPWLGLAALICILSVASTRLDIWPRLPSSSSGAGATLRADGGDAAVLEGHAVALSGEMIRLQGRLLHLSGIEAPETQQTCTRADKRTWQCGQSALAALERLARSRTFRCTASGGPDDTGRIEATCTADGEDVAGALVKAGHVFSTSGFFGGYAALEFEARSTGSGVWSGDAQRPTDYRAKLWSDAAAASPDGCPIKGVVTGRHRTYVMPWSPRYAKTTVRTSHGDRWFCSENDARAGGFGPVSARE